MRLASIVCEKSGSWAAAIRAAANQAPNFLQETRSLVQCWEALAENPSSFLVLEVRIDNFESLLEQLSELSRRWPKGQAAVVGTRRWRDCEWLFREAGAVHVQFSPRWMKPLVDLIRRHQATTLQEQPELQQAILKRLPWKPVT
jgi:hypothetical protein